MDLNKILGTIFLQWFPGSEGEERVQLIDFCLAQTGESKVNLKAD